MRIGDTGAPPAPPASEGDGDLISAGEDLYALMLAGLSELPLATQLEIAGAFQGKKAWSDLSVEVTAAFDAIAEAFLDDEEDESGDGEDPDEDDGADD